MSPLWQGPVPLAPTPSPKPAAPSGCGPTPVSTDSCVFLMSCPSSHLLLTAHEFCQLNSLEPNHEIAHLPLSTDKGLAGSQCCWRQSCHTPGTSLRGTPCPTRSPWHGAVTRGSAVKDKGWSIAASPASLPTPGASGSTPSLHAHPQH